jgi:hypothetical protein
MKSAQSLNIRISSRSKIALRTMAKREGKPMQAVLDEAIERYRRDKFLDDVNAAFARLRADPKAWKEEQAERALWDKTLADGLEDK